MKVQTKWFLSAISAFIVVILVSVFTGLGTIKSNLAKYNSEVLLTSVSKVGNVE